MAETIVDAERTALAADAATRLTHLSLYSGDPESGGTEAANLVARQAINWTPGAAGVQNKSGGDIVITLNGITAFDHLCIFDSLGLATGTLRAKRNIGSHSFGSAGGGTVTVTSGSITISST